MDVQSEGPGWFLWVDIGSAHRAGLSRDWGGEKMLNPLLKSYPDFIPKESLVLILDFRLRILDLWNRYALSNL
jgi:hypothetical protein